MTADDLTAALSEVTDPKTKECLGSMRSYIADRGKGSVPDSGREFVFDYIAYWLPRHAGSSAKGKQQGPQPEPNEVLQSLEQLAVLMARNGRCFDKAEWLAAMAELRITLPRAIELTNLLTEEVCTRGGPFEFQEFLTTFEEGGRAEYDFDIAGEEKVIEGHFRITSADGPLVAAVELVSERLIDPIVFPESAAEFVEPGQIATLEIMRRGDRWIITDCDVVFPPGTPVV
ncbi:MAG TPA: hypothetical protein VFV34_14910 [Blastocatellia bacterium]|nr:hypothetical protein [Blastocatellia bacterium]